MLSFAFQTFGIYVGRGGGEGGGRGRGRLAGSRAYIEYIYTFLLWGGVENKNNIQ